MSLKASPILSFLAVAAALATALSVPSPAAAACLMVRSEFRWDRPFVRDVAKAADLIVVARVTSADASSATLQVLRVLKGQAGAVLEVPDRDALLDCVQGSVRVGQRVVYIVAPDFENAPPEFFFQELPNGRFAFQFYSFASLERLVDAMELLPDTDTAGVSQPSRGMHPLAPLALLGGLALAWATIAFDGRRRIET